MTTNYKVLGQSAPASATLSTLYAVPADTQTVVSTITACNLAADISSIRVAVRPSGASISNQHYIVYDLNLDPSETITLTLGITMAATDVLSVRASQPNAAFSAFGSEISLGT